MQQRSPERKPSISYPFTGFSLYVENDTNGTNLTEPADQDRDVSDNTKHTTRQCPPAKHDGEKIGDRIHIQETGALVKENNHVQVLCGIPINRRFRMVFYCFTYFWAGVAFSLPAPFYPQVASKKGMSLTETGLIFSVYQLMIFIACPFFGSYLRTIGPKFAFTSGIIVAGACSILFGTLYMCPPGSTFFVLSILVRSVTAIGFASFYTSLMAAASSEYPNKVATAMALIQLSFAVGMMTGPTIGGALYTAGGFGLPFYVLGGVVLVVGVFTDFVMPSPKLEHRNKSSASLFSLLRSPLVVIAVLSTTAGSLGISFLEPTLAPHLEPFGLPIVLIGLFFVITPCGHTIASPVIGHLSDVKGIHKELVVIGQFIFGIGFLFVGPSNLLPFLPNQLWTVTLGLFIIGFTFSCTVVPSYKFIMVGAIEVGFGENTNTYGLVAGIAGSVYSLGAFVGPMAGGLLVQQLGDSTAFTVIGLMNIGVSGTAVILLTIRRFRGTRKYNDDAGACGTNGTITCDERTPLITH